MLAEMGIETGIDPGKTAALSLEIAGLLGIDPRSHRANGATRKSVAGTRRLKSSHEIFMTMKSRRSLLAVPATSPRFLEKAAQGPADAVFIDLEDAVSPSLKVKARADAIAALNELDWGQRIVAVRVNGFGYAMGLPRHP